MPRRRIDRDLAPLLVVEEGGHDRSVVVLDGAAPRLGPCRLDAAVVAQDAGVVAHGRERLVEEPGELDRAGLPAIDDRLHDAPAQRVGQRLDEAFVERGGCAHGAADANSARGAGGAPGDPARPRNGPQAPFMLAEHGSIGFSSISMFTRFTSLARHGNGGDRITATALRSSPDRDSRPLRNRLAAVAVAGQPAHAGFESRAPRPPGARRASWPSDRRWRALVTYSVRRSGPPNAGLVGLVTGRRIAVASVPSGAIAAHRAAAEQADPDPALGVDRQPVGQPVARIDVDERAPVGDVDRWRRRSRARRCAASCCRRSTSARRRGSTPSRWRSSSPAMTRSSSPPGREAVQRRGPGVLCLDIVPAHRRPCGSHLQSLKRLPGRSASTSGEGPLRVAVEQQQPVRRPPAATPERGGAGCTALTSPAISRVATPPVAGLHAWIRPRAMSTRSSSPVRSSQNGPSPSSSRACSATRTRSCPVVVAMWIYSDPISSRSSTSLAGEVAIVTGGSRGIGRAIVELFLREGAAVAFCGREEAAGREVLSAARRRRPRGLPGRRRRPRGRRGAASSSVCADQLGAALASWSTTPASTPTTTRCR